VGYCSSHCFGRSNGAIVLRRDSSARARIERLERLDSTNERPTTDDAAHSSFETFMIHSRAHSSTSIQSRGGGTREESSPTDPMPRKIPIGHTIKSHVFVVHKTHTTKKNEWMRLHPTSTSDDPSHTPPPAFEKLLSKRNALDRRRDDISRLRDIHLESS
jgi:hypothetical protein